MTKFFPTKILHVDLGVGPGQQALVGDGRAVYLVFWYRGVPLGHRQLRAETFPLPPIQLWNMAAETITPAVGAYVLTSGFEPPLPEFPRDSSRNVPPDFRALLALAEPLSVLDIPTPGARPDAPDVSVVVCTRDRPDSLQQCLQSLSRCCPLPTEVVVVDNCPTSDATRHLAKRHPHVHYVLEPQPGLDVARNTGIRHTQGSIVAFVDDDVTVHPDWVARLRESFSDPDVMAVTGLVLPAELETEAQVLFEQHWGFNRGYHVLTFDSEYFRKLKPWGVPTWHFGAGANMAFRREAFALVGDFDVRLDVGAAGCSGDSEFWYRLLAEGYRCRYDPRVTAFHYHRRDMTGLRRQMHGYMRGHTAALLIQFAKHKHWGNLVRLFLLLPAYYAKLIAQGLRHGFQPRHRLIPTEWGGCLSGLFYFLRNMRSV
jgi:glycosyltransferase involved in cell wall biosynthesis